MYIVIGSLCLLTFAWFALREWAKATTWGTPRWPVAERPFECRTCGRRFPVVPMGVQLGRFTPDAPDSEPDALLALHVRYQHQGAPGPLHAWLAARDATRAQVRVLPVRAPAERWHKVQHALMTAEQWGRVLPFSREARR